MNIVSTESTKAAKRPYELKERARRQEETRERIAAATAALHEEVGPARTTVTEIAKRAGVQRLTVYKHFPDEAELFAGCSAHYLQRHPFPDVSEAVKAEDPRRRVRDTLALLYGWFRENERMTANIRRDRLLMPALDARASQTVDPALNFIAEQLVEGFGASGDRARRIAALVAVAMEFWTWQRLKDAGLDDESAAELMSGVIARA